MLAPHITTRTVVGTSTLFYFAVAQICGSVLFIVTGEVPEFTDKELIRGEFQEFTDKELIRVGNSRNLVLISSLKHQSINRGIH